MRIGVVALSFITLGISLPTAAESGVRAVDLVPVKLGIFRLRAVDSPWKTPCYSPQVIAYYEFDPQRGIPESVSDIPGVDWGRGNQWVNHSNGTMTPVETGDFGFGITLQVNRLDNSREARTAGCRDVKRDLLKYIDSKTMRVRTVPRRKVEVAGHEAFIVGSPERSGLGLPEEMGLAVSIDWSVPGWDFMFGIGPTAREWQGIEKYATEAAREAAAWMDSVLAKRVAPAKRAEQAAALRKALAQAKSEEP